MAAADVRFPHTCAGRTSGVRTAGAGNVPAVTAMRARFDYMFAGTDQTRG
jgi:hypothetical protein